MNWVDITLVVLSVLVIGGVMVPVTANTLAKIGERDAIRRWNEARIKAACQIPCGTVYIGGLKYRTAGEMGDAWPCNHQATKFWANGCDVFCYCGSCSCQLPNDAHPITKQEADRVLAVYDIMTS